ILSIFVVFAACTIHEIRWLEDYQVNVVQKNLKASLELLRLQNDAYLLAISLRDMTAARARYPIHEWRPEFIWMRRDMDDAARLEGEIPVSTPASSAKRSQSRHTPQGFWRPAGSVSTLAPRL